MQRRLARFLADECWGKQDVGHGIVATGRGALQFRSFNRYAAGSHLFAFPAGASHSEDLYKWS
ncbi:hypothetical protein [Rummeliibacillus suwonensis]|uniref:hypothetical protein n=1 Tax=Rummeliibacillus suwonensis TaxID=1306154 RepID=UPI001AAECABD|nr:hypothetical protein [Rummeliibacillus suwonensis]MBO2535696.1 hypothetical protein [Rummeliibacillus suwonensis]